MIADNRIAELATWDREKVAEELRFLTDIEFDAIDATGFAVAEIDLRLDEKREKENDFPPDEALPDLSDKIAIRRGDCIILGKHRLYCGDATSEADMQALMAGELSDCVLTDPPYNRRARDISRSGRHSNFQMAGGEMSEQEFIGFLSRFLSTTTPVTKPGGVLFVAMDWRGLYALQSAARGVGIPQLNMIVWAKPNAGLGSLYRSQFELFAVFRNGAEQHTNNVELGRHGRNRTNLWQHRGATTFHSDRAEELARHVTPKPVELLADAIRDVTRRGQIVLDPFAGGGSLIIAAEKTGRKARVMEIDPKFCDRIVRRWQIYSGKQAKFEASGELYDDVLTGLDQRNALTLPSHQGAEVSS